MLPPPQNPELLTTVGLLYLRLGENYKAFDYLGQSLTYDQRNPKTILAAGSIIQVCTRARIHLRSRTSMWAHAYAHLAAGAITHAHAHTE